MPHPQKMAPLSLNRVFLAGCIASHPELRFVPSGKAVTEFMLEIEQDEAPGHALTTQVFPVIAWEDLAVWCGNSLCVGDRVWVEGKLTIRMFKDTTEHVRKECEIVAVTVQKIDHRTGPLKRAEKS